MSNASTSPVETGSYLPGVLGQRVNDFRIISDNLQYPHQSEYGEIGAAEQLSQVVMPLLRATYAFTGSWALGVPDLDLEKATSDDNLDKILRARGLLTAVTDAQSEVYTGMASLATGLALSRRDSDRAKVGYELGRRLINERARFAAHQLLTATVFAKYEDFYEGHRNLYLSAGRYHDSTNRMRSPLRNVPKSSGARYERLEEKVYEPGGTDMPDLSKGKTLQLPTKGAFKNFRIARRVGAKGIDLRAGLRDPDSDFEAIEEAYETFLPGRHVLDLSSSDVSFIGEFASKLKVFYEAAGRTRPDIAGHPALPFISFIVSTLKSSTNIARLETAYKKTAESVGRKEKQPTIQ